MNLPTKEQVLLKYWGYDKFREGQEPLIDSVLSGKDSVGLMPTGGGKSLCYQVPGLCMSGITIVISPLISLMKDQVDALTKRKIKAYALFGGIPQRQIINILDTCEFGDVKFLYLSPERLTVDWVRQRIARMNVNLIAIDEAHCVSQWGYDFRPSYLSIHEIRKYQSGIPMMALTATATPETVDDMIEKYGLIKPFIISNSFNRRNLNYYVIQEENKLKRIQYLLEKVPGTGIIYCRNRKTTVRIAEYLKNYGITSGYYHAGMKSADREKVQKAWMQNTVRVVTATSAFGMGIDKSDVRIVIHHDLPDSPEEYFQEAGRAGRDGNESFCVLLFNEGDISRKKMLFEKSFPEMIFIKRVYKALGHFFQLAVGSGEDSTYPFSLRTFCNNYKLEILKTHNTLKILEEAGWISLSDGYYRPATFYFTQNRRELYNYQVSHEENNILINALLRNHESPWGAPVILREEKIKNQLHLSKVTMHKQLQKLQMDGLLEFESATEDPFITFLLPRSSSGNLTINQQLFEFRLSLHKKRLDSMISYVSDKSCRNHFLNDYFGQEKSGDCQICDNCLGMHGNSSDDEIEDIRNKIMKLLGHTPHHLNKLLGQFSVTESKKFIDTLELMEEEGSVRIENDLVYLVQ